MKHIRKKEEERKKKERKKCVKLREIRPFSVELAVLCLSSPENVMKGGFDVDRNACATYFRFSWALW
jgi:hypothetical protein